MDIVVVEILLLLILILINGVLAMSELAVVSARKPRLQQMAENGSRGAANALKLAESPGQFLSTVQVGITLVGIFTGALGGATLARALSVQLAKVSALAAYADPLAFGVVVVALTYLSLVLGELVPKRLALFNAEGVAARIAPLLAWLAKVARPFVHILNTSTEAILRLLGRDAPPEPSVTEEEVRLMLSEATEQGVFEPIEEVIVDQVFRLADRKVGALITPRTEMEWLDINASFEEQREQITKSGRSRYPVADGQLDKILGIVLAKDLLAQSLAGEPLDLAAIMRPALFVPESMPALLVVERFKQTHSKIALVIDEYGGVEGLVTVDDIMGAIVGEIPDPEDLDEPDVIQRSDGTWLVDGLYDIEDFQAFFDLDALPEATEGYYQTVGGFVMAGLGRVPKPGDTFDWGGLQLEVMDMDGRRVDKVLVKKVDVTPALSDEGVSDEG